jgi:hypothetical protein
MPECSAEQTFLKMPSGSELLQYITLQVVLSKRLELNLLKLLQCMAGH